MALATQSAVAELICFEPTCRTRYAITDVLYNCPKCGGLLEATYSTDGLDADKLKRTFRERTHEQYAPSIKAACGVIASCFRSSMTRVTSSLCAKAIPLCSTHPSPRNSAASTGWSSKHQGLQSNWIFQGQTA
ncbi:MAG: hypothetical protein WDO18_06815 [Acidobacteriota bacterium]